jgi:hypothetical protein
MPTYEPMLARVTTMWFGQRFPVPIPSFPWCWFTLTTTAGTLEAPITLLASVATLGASPRSSLAANYRGRCALSASCGVRSTTESANIFGGIPKTWHESRHGECGYDCLSQSRAGGVSSVSHPLVTSVIYERRGSGVCGTHRQREHL